MKKKISGTAPSLLNIAILTGEWANLGKMFEGDYARTCAGKYSAHVDRGPSGGPCVRRPGSEDPHWHEQKFSSVIHFQ